MSQNATRSLLLALAYFVTGRVGLMLPIADGLTLCRKR